MLFSVGVIEVITFVYADSFARPDSDPSVRWVTTVGSPPCEDLNTFNCVDEPTRDDSDYVQTIGLGNGNTDTQHYTLSDIADPNRSDNHFIRYAISEGNSGTNPVGFTIELRQGVDGTLIASNTLAQGTIPSTFTTFEYELTSSEADSITDYNDLTIKMIATCETGCSNSPSSREQVLVSWVEFAIVDGFSPPVLDSVEVASSTSLLLTWTPPADQSDIQSYNILRDSGSGLNFLTNVPNGTTSYLDENLMANTFYDYQLETVFSSQNSTGSNIVGQTTQILQVLSSFALPDGDPSTRWVNGIGADPCTDLLTFNCVDEIERDDTDYIQTIGLGNGNTDTQFYTLSDIADPQQSSGHVLRYTLREANEGINPVGFEIQLRQGVTEIAKFTHSQGTLPKTDFVVFERILNSTQADSITDYSDLELTLTANCLIDCTNGIGDREKVQVSWVHFGIDKEGVPTTLTIKTVGQDELDSLWSPPTNNGSSAINGYQIERENCGKKSCKGDFQVIGFVNDFNFTDSTLNSTEQYQYRIRSNNTEGLSDPSLPKIGVTSSINIASLKTVGSSLEPSLTHSFNKTLVDRFISALELYEPDTLNLDEVVKELRNEKTNAYQTLLKIDNATFNFDLSLINGTNSLTSEYISKNNLNDWFAVIQQISKSENGVTP